MKSYILSILGIIISGILIDVIIPSGTINKYIKSIYSIFVIAVLIMPLINFIKNSNNLSLNYNEIRLQENLTDYIIEKRVASLEDDIELHLSQEGFEKIDIELKYSTKNNEIVYNSCEINLKNMLISSDKQHINRYEFIKKVVIDYTSLGPQEIVINE